MALLLSFSQINPACFKSLYPKSWPKTRRKKKTMTGKRAECPCRSNQADQDSGNSPHSWHTWPCILSASNYHTGLDERINALFPRDRTMGIHSGTLLLYANHSAAIHFCFPFTNLIRPFYIYSTRRIRAPLFLGSFFFWPRSKAAAAA